MKVGIIGSGISGLTAAWLLNQEHEITIFEANDYIGGHTHTVAVEVDAIQYDIDTGFIVFNEWTYPNFIALLGEIKVQSVPTSMGFSVRCDLTNLEYCGSGLNGLFSQRANLLRPRFYRLIADILRFNREAPRFLDGPQEETVGDFLSKHGYSAQFAEQYLLPMGAAIWSCPMETFEKFPIRFIIEFYVNHGLLLITGRPTWRTIAGGSHKYIEKLTADFRDRILLNSPVLGVRRHSNHVEVRLQDQVEVFDEVIFACHSDQALKILDDADDQELELLQKFPYSRNVALLHTDESVLPKRRRAWASWNYHLRKERSNRPSVTYNMNILQHIESEKTFCVTLNEEDLIDESKVLGRYQYSHPVFTVERKFAQLRHSELIRHRRTSFCGAYWGNGFHEDGVNSALAVCRAYGILPRWQMPERLAETRLHSPAGLGETT